MYPSVEIIVVDGGYIAQAKHFTEDGDEYFTTAVFSTLAGLISYVYDYLGQEQETSGDSDGGIKVVFTPDQS